MPQKTVLTATIITAASLVVGFGLGRLTAPGGLSQQTVDDLYVEREAYNELQNRAKDLAEQIKRQTVEAARLAHRNNALQARVAALVDQVKPQEEAAAAAAAKSSKGPPISFGKWKNLDAVKNANWDEMGEAIAVINELLADLMERKKQGLPVDVDFQKKVAEQNNKLVKYAAALMGKIPTHSPINGEFSHPITIANLMDAMLDRAELPLSEEQTKAIARFGEEYEKEYDNLQGTYSEDTPRLEKLIDELELKRDCVDEMQAVLTEEQQDAIIYPDIHHRAQMDTLSPATMAALIARPQFVQSKEDLRKRVDGILSKEYGLDVKGNEQLQQLEQSLLKDLEPLMEKPVPPRQPAHVDEIVVAGRAQANFVAALLKASPDLDEAKRNTLLSMTTWLVPRLAPQEKKAADKPAGESE